ncbi:hypothetical protein CALVIDRAFT_223834 [Calocera viscosa TUFC12733]|uniref:Uncharacterized protein n=1 Tax=Calocera viscosa (strain TUFC12733) TaxID=1330018 RepID=A0A167K841_CALVF|nr:hypothetical protein CALVIDRAFT_223834 [Calocera viscosa TUFC12733]
MYQFMQSSHATVDQLAIRAAELMCAAVRKHGNDLGNGYLPTAAVETIVGVGFLLLTLISLSSPEIRRKAITSSTQRTLLPVFFKYTFYHVEWIADSCKTVCAMLTNQRSASQIEKYRAATEGKKGCKLRHCSKTWECAHLFQCGRYDLRATRSHSV